MKVGTTIRKIRRQQQRTLQEIADACSVTRSLLSKIETGKSMPPIATLTRIARALGVDCSRLLDENESCGTVFAARKEREKKGLTRTEKGYSFFPFAGGLTDKKMQPYYFVARKSEVSPESMSHAGEEFVFVLEGRMTYRVGGQQFTLGPGDSLYFDSAEPHDLQPVSTEVRYLAVFVDNAAARERKKR